MHFTLLCHHAAHLQAGWLHSSAEHQGLLQSPPPVSVRAERNVGPHGPPDGQ